MLYLSLILKMICMTSPDCGCAEVREDAEHFFFGCPYFEDKRIAMFHSINIFHPLNLQKIFF